MSSHSVCFLAAGLILLEVNFSQPTLTRLMHCEGEQITNRNTQTKLFSFNYLMLVYLVHLLILLQLASSFSFSSSFQEL